MERLFRRSATLLILSVLFIPPLVASTLGQGRTQARTFPYRFLIPEGYVGWIRIDFDVKGASEIPIEDGFYIFKVPETGRLQTSSSDVVDSVRNQFFYYSAGTQYRIRLGGPLEGRLVQEEFSGPGSGHLPPVPNHYRYIFIGPLSAFERYRATDPKARLTESDGYPKVGAETWLTPEDLKKINAIRP